MWETSSFTLNQEKDILCGEELKVTFKESEDQEARELDKYQEVIKVKDNAMLEFLKKPTRMAR